MMNKDQKLALFRQALEQAGSNSTLAAAVRVSPATISNWSKAVPDAAVETLQEYLRTGPISRSELRGVGDARRLLAAHRVYADVTGLEWGSVHYRCMLLPSDELGIATGRVETRYVFPKVSPDLGSTVFQIRNVSDGLPPTSQPEPLQVSGPGVQYDASSDFVETVIRRRAPGGPESSKVERVYSIRLDHNASEETTIIARRLVTKGFPLVRRGKGTENGKNDERDAIQYAGYKVTRPTRNLRLDLIFATGLFREAGRAGLLPVSVVAFGPYSFNPADFDLRRVSSLLINHPCRTLSQLEPDTAAEGEMAFGWTWESDTPPVMGMLYALAFEVASA